MVDPLVALRAKPLYQFTESEVGLYLAHLQQTEPDLRRRILHLARRHRPAVRPVPAGRDAVRDPDPQPLYCLTKSDCLVFSEHVYAMALSSD
ncbi:MAG: hypothetical protein U1F61_30090 [Opitutaceae bacterium]